MNLLLIPRQGFTVPWSLMARVSLGSPGTLGAITTTTTSSLTNQTLQVFGV